MKKQTIILLMALLVLVVTYLILDNSHIISKEERNFNICEQKFFNIKEFNYLNQKNVVYDEMINKLKEDCKEVRKNE